MSTHFSPVCRVAIFTILWVGFWYLSTTMFFTDVAAAYWAAGVYSSYVIVPLYILVEILAHKKQVTSARMWKTMGIIVLGLMIASPIISILTLFIANLASFF